VFVVLVTLPAASAAAAINIESIRYDPAGDDDGSNASLNGERIRIENTGVNARTLRGWTIHDSDHTVFYFPRLRVGGGEVVTIHTGTGDNTRRHLYWDLTIYVWDNDGDAARLYDRRMREVDNCSYTGGGILAAC
jgi:Lamin Tail Domain